MDEISRIIEDNFFIIDSNNLDDIDDDFYGFSIDSNDLIKRENIDSHELGPLGAYVKVDVNQDEILIRQDFVGSYELYIYEDDDYFAVSNSFLKLSEHLRDKCPLSLNRDFANSFLFADLCAFSYDETLINEIRIIPKEYEVIINKASKSLSLRKVDYGERSIPVDSRQGIELLDTWYFRWVDIIRSIKRRTNNMSFDLTGGFDTRIIAAIWLTANIDLDKVYIYTLEEVKRNMNLEDIRIASKIADSLGLKLNRNVFDIEETAFENPMSSISLSFYPKLGFHKQMYFRHHVANQNWFSISGFGGEIIRGPKTMHWYNSYMNQEDHSIELLSDIYTYKVVNSAKHRNYHIETSSRDILSSSKSSILDNFNADDDELTERMYNDIRLRHHTGKTVVEQYMSNEVILTPLVDPDLCKLKFDSDRYENVLIALIFMRYCPKLLEFEFEGNRGIDDDAIDFAKAINEKYPFKPREYDFISGPEVPRKDTSVKLNSKVRQKDDFSVDKMKELVYSEKFRLEFIRHFPFNFYYDIIESLDTIHAHPLKNVFSAVAIMKAIFDIEYPKHKLDYSLDEWFDYCINCFDGENRIRPKDECLLLKHNRARIDVKNQGKSNSIRIIDNSDDGSYEQYVKRDDGEILVVESYKSGLDLKILCVGDGKLKIKLRGNAIKSANDERIATDIDYTSLIVDGKPYVEGHELCSFRKHFTIDMDVKDSQVVDIHAEWMPVSRFVDYEDRERKLRQSNKKLKQKLKALKEENKRLKDDSDTESDKKRNKISSIFKK